MNKFTIVAEIRSGYQYLASLLNSNPDILCLGEIFGSKRNIRKKSLFDHPLPEIKDEDDAVDYVENKLFPYCNKKGYKAAGFKLNYVCAREGNWKNLWDHIKNNNWKVIHLIRENLLDRLISQRLAVSQNRWNNKKYDLKPIEITYEELEYCTNRSCEWQQELNKFFTKNLLSVTYECLDTSEVQKFLGMKPVPLMSTLKKQRTQGQSKYVQNYWELKKECESKKKYVEWFTDNFLVI